MIPPSLHILVVDDEPSIGEIFTSLLESFGHRVSYCRSAVEAFQKQKGAQTEFDLVITDHHMPGSWSGLDLVRMIRRKGCRVPIMVASGQLNPELIAEYRAQDVCGLLPKPFDLQRIVTAVNELAKTNEGAWPAPAATTLYPAVQASADAA